MGKTVVGGNVAKDGSSAEQAYVHRNGNGRSNQVGGTAEADQKFRGGYYTPAVIGRALAEWALVQSEPTVLEPSAGDGQLVAAAAERLGGRGRITAVELYADEARKIDKRGYPSVEVVAGDFFSWFADRSAPASFDAVLGNPPFIRYQQFREDHRQSAFALMRDEGLNPTRLTNAWLPFVVGATRALRDGGRLALVLPAELLQVTYAGELREYLVRNYSHLTVVTFRKLLFDAVLQETVLLLGERQRNAAARIAFVELDGLDCLDAARFSDVEEVEVDLKHGREKWTQYYLSATELGLVRELEQSAAFGRLGDFASVDVGVVTGRNEFFVLNEAEAERWGVRPWCLPLVGRSSQTPGLVLRQDEWEALARAGGKCLLLQLGSTDRADLSDGARAYVEFGEAQEFHTGYKCRIRLPRWWNVPSAWVPDAFLLRQIYDGPRIIANRTGATSTDTIHRLRTMPDIDPDWMAGTSMNSLTWAFTEIRGRSYGGGVLELEPTEAEGLPFPKPGALGVALDDLDRIARTQGVEAVMDAVDLEVLVPAGLSRGDIAVLRGIWRKLYRRRMSRKRA